MLHTIFIAALSAVTYSLICYMVAFLGRERKFRFFGYFVISVFFTPIIGLLVVFASDKRKDKNTVITPKT